MHTATRRLALLAAVFLVALGQACGSKPERVFAPEGQPIFVRLTEHVTSFEAPATGPLVWRELDRAESLPVVLSCSGERRIRLEVAGPPTRIVVKERDRLGRRKARHKDLAWTNGVGELVVEIHPATTTLEVFGDEGPRDVRLLGTPLVELLRDRDAQYRSREGRRSAWHEEAVVRTSAGRELRTSLLCLEGGHTETSIQVPGGAPQLELDTYFSIRQAYSSATLRVTVLEGDDVRLVKWIPVTPRERWSDQAIDLRDVAGRTVRIRFEVVESQLDNDTVPAIPACIVVGDPIVRATAWRDPRPNVVLISLDTLRADHLGLYGYDRETSPHIDALAREGVVFEDAWSSSSYTLPAHHSILSGQAVASHGVYKAWDSFDPTWTPNLFETLAEAGYRTMAVTSSGFLDPRGGFGRGCDVHYYDGPIHKSDEELKHLDDILEEAGTPVAVFLHSYFTHNYDPFGEDLAFFGGSEEDRVELLTITNQLHHHELGPEQRKLQLERLERLYNATIRGADRQIGRLFDELRDSGQLHNTVVVLVSDHGEEFDEHGDYGHGRQLYEETVRVPMIVQGPGVPRGVRVAAPVSLVDVAPTIASLLGVPYDATRVDGRPLVPLLEGADLTRAIVAESDDLQAIRIGAAKALWQSKTKIHGTEGRVELFDLSLDPGERNDVSALQPDALAHLRSVMDESRSRGRARVASEERVEVDPDLLQQLEALGYLGGEP